MNHEILTERLRLRFPRDTDAQAIYDRYAKDPEVVKYLSWKPHTSVEETLAMRKYWQRKIDKGHSVPYLITAREDERVMGMISVHPKDAFKAGIGYVLGKKEWGRGYMTEALKAVIAEAWQNSTYIRLSAFCDVENIGSYRVMEKAGMRFEGIARAHSVLPNMGPTPRDLKSYAIIKGD